MHQLHVERYQGPEDGAPLVILHGLFGSAANWRSIAKRLSADRQVMAMDLRNHGRSFHHEAMNYLLMARDVLETLDALGLDTVDLLGHSMGGKTAMVCGLEASERVNRLIVVDIAPVAYRHSHLDLIKAMRALDLSSLQSRQDADRILSRSIPETPVRLFLLHNLELKDKTFRWRLNLPAIETHLPFIMDFPDFGEGRYTGPTLFAHGQLSGYLRDEHKPAIDRLFPAVEYAEIANAGHWVQAEQPKMLIERISGFLS